VEGEGREKGEKPFLPKINAYPRVISPTFPFFIYDNFKIN